MIKEIDEVVQKLSQREVEQELWLRHMRKTARRRLGMTVPLTLLMR